MIKIKKSSRALLWMLVADFCNFQLFRATHSRERFRPRFAGWEGTFSLKRLIILAFILVSSNCHAATYYFSTSGNNSNGNGTQQAPFYSLCGPWQSSGCATGESKISLGQIAINPGDQLLFKRGDEWVGINAQWNINTTGSSGNPVVFGAWGDESLPRPIFRGAKSAFELGKDNWTNVAGTPIWYTTGITWWPHMAAQEDGAPGGPALFGAWSVQGVTNTNGWTLNQSMVRGTHFYDSSTQRLYVWRSDDQKPDHAAGRDIFIGGAPYDGTDRMIKVNRGTAAGGYYEFRDLHVKMGTGYGFATSLPNTSYYNCLAELNGMEGFIFDASRWGAPSPGAKDGLMKKCVSRRNNLRQGSAIGQGITVESPNVTIEDSESYENAWAGIDFLDYNSKTNASGKVINCNIHHNGIHPVSQANFDPNIYIDGGHDVTIQNTRVWAAGVDPRGVKTRLRPNPGIVVGAEPPAISLGKQVKNIKIINSMSYGNAGEALKIYTLDGTDAISNIEIIGSTLHRDRGDSDIKGYSDPNTIDAGIRVFNFKDMTGGLVFKNNIVLAMNTARAPMLGTLAQATGGNTLADFDYNMYYCPGCNYNTTGGFWNGGFFSHGYLTNITLDQWRNLGASADAQQDATLSKTVITANPLLANLSVDSFDARLLDGSPAIDIADATVFTFPVSGSTRPDGSEDNPYNDLGYHYPSTGPPIQPVLDTQAPTAPTSLAAAQLGGQVFLSWNSSTDNVGVARYEVYDGAVPLGTTSTTGYTMNNPVIGQSYLFTVIATDAANNSSPASNSVSLTVAPDQDTTAPTAPAGLKATLSGTQVSLSWDASTDNTGVDHYEIQNNGSVIGTSVSTAFLHAGTAGATYNYTIIALDASGNKSAPSSIVTVTIPLPPPTNSTAPTAPTNLVVNTVGTQVQLTWAPSTGQTGYNVYKNGAYLKSVTTTSTYDNAVTNGNVYTYYIKAYNINNVKSDPSNSVSITIGGGSTADNIAPSVPTNVVASLLVNQLSTAWTASTDNVGVSIYKIFNNAVQIATSSASPYLLNSPVIGSTYAMSVQACDAAGNCSAQSSVSTVLVPDTVPPAAPTSLQSSLSGSDIQLSWAAGIDNLGVAGYQVYENASLVGTTSTTTYTFGPVAAGRTYTFFVKTFDSAGNQSDASALAVVPVPDNLPPTAPQNLNVILSGTTAKLNWTAATDNVGVASYQVFQGASVVGSTTAVSFDVPGLVSGQNYTFLVKALDAANNVSAPSNAVTVGLSGPIAPTNLVAYSTGSSIYVGWSTVTNAAGYAVYRNDLFYKNVTSGSLYDTSIVAGQTYTYKVQAYDNASNYSGFSNSMSVTLPSGLLAPANLVGVRQGKKVTLTWGAVSKAKGYNIYRDGAYLTSASTMTFYDAVGSATQAYRYTVKAFDATGLKSPASNEVTV